MYKQESRHHSLYISEVTLYLLHLKTNKVQKDSSSLNNEIIHNILKILGCDKTIVESADSNLIIKSMIITDNY